VAQADTGAPRRAPAVDLWVPPRTAPMASSIPDDAIAHHAS
jgi:hypothetical protein